MADISRMEDTNSSDYCLKKEAIDFMGEILIDSMQPLATVKMTQGMKDTSQMP